MAHVIKVKPDKDGKVFITLYGDQYEIVVEKPKKKDSENENSK